MDKPLVSIQIVVYNGERYIRHCLDAVKAQTYDNLEVIILDNASTDRTVEIIRNWFPEYELASQSTNIGMWPGQEALLSRTHGKYILVLSVDVILDKDFITKAVQACEDELTISGVQGKFYQYCLDDLKIENWQLKISKTIDSCGFAMTRGRKVVIIGHGQKDSPRFIRQKIFGVEGAAPFFRRSALEDCRVLEGKIIDPDYFWYGDDLDLVWRMTVLGHTQMFIPEVIAWHDRATTKGTAMIPVLGQLKRLRIRRQLPLIKRRLDWSNVRFTIIKNDYIINILRDLPFILTRELSVFAYTLLFEPKVLVEFGRFFRLLPRILRRRRQVMARAIAKPQVIHHYFI